MLVTFACFHSRVDDKKKSCDLFANCKVKEKNWFVRNEICMTKID